MFVVSATSRRGFKEWVWLQGVGGGVKLTSAADAGHIDSQNRLSNCSVRL